MDKVKFIAEISSNHNRDIGRMKEFISVSKDIGCSGVKFQLFKIDQLFAPEILNKSKVHRARKKWELPQQLIPELAEYAHSLELDFSCTPFYLDAVDLINPYVDFHKIGSYELLWLDLFRKCSNTGKPIIFSTGMSTQDEIESALDEISKGRTKDVIILHCNSAYPTNAKDVNLKALTSLNQKLASWGDKLNIKFGLSDHTVSENVIYNAVYGYGVDFVEFHLDLDGKGEEYQSGHCWLPDQIGECIRNIKIGLSANGDGEIVPSISELSEREWRADPSDGLRPLLQMREKF